MKPAAFLAKHQRLILAVAMGAAWYRKLPEAA